VDKSLLNVALHDHVPSGLPIRMLTVGSNLKVDDVDGNPGRRLGDT
jgi:hypothetical protein